MSVPRSLYSVRKLTKAAVIVLSLPGLALAQRGGMARGGFGMGHAGVMVARAGVAPRAVAAAPRSIMRAPRAPSSPLRVGTPGQTRSINRGPRFSNPSTAFGEFGGFNDVPGLGFDFPHLAAISGGRRMHRFGGFFGGAPFFDGGFLFGSPSVIVEEAPPAEAPPEPEDAISGDAVEPARRPMRQYQAQAPPAPAPQSAPQPEQEQYVFVQLDGELLFAVAYSWDNGTLRYITPEGARRSITRDALDLNATEQFNEQRGVNFHAPA